MFVFSDLIFLINLLNPCLYLVDFTQQYIPYSAGSYKTSNTWANPNNKPGNNTQPSAMLMMSNSQGNANTYWILVSVQAFMLLVNPKILNNINILMVQIKFSSTMVQV